ncbi:MAG: class I tRNA ligase family protein [Candidatus Moranbacteria bacterium]|nr:class I tRNA ligase family protein [Candidatus Moranbacteria bacterium]
MTDKQELNKAYNPKDYEEEIYQKWEESGNFNPDNLDLPEDAPSYTIVLPPPNITDRLHLGHSSMLAIEDLMIRFHRMNGYRTLWIPGTDHAAIATQNVVEKKLLEEEGLTRHDLGREKFLERVWAFLNETQATILEQTRRTGASLDWSRNAFTLDAQREKAVQKMFADMYEAGVIYRGERIVNWCPRCHSTLADDEIEYKPQEAKFYTFKYDKDFPIAISTTRPETKLGDTAVAVNPEDKRYQKYIGKTYQASFCGIKLDIKIIADKSIDMEFGTGALGVTPAHSMADWQMAQANELPIVKVIDEDGLIHPSFGEFGGMKAEDAREKAAQCLRDNKLMENEEEIENNLSICYRCDTSIEPLPSKQWFVSVDKKLDFLGGKSLKEKSLEATQNKEIEFIPERFYKKYAHWMENLHDWCISRQIWFGHRIPVWYRERSQKSKVKSQNLELNFREKKIFDLIKDGKKKVETRALNPEEKNRYFGNIKTGDNIILNYKVDDYVVESLRVKVKDVQFFQNREDLLKKYSIKKILPGMEEDEIQRLHQQIPGYEEKIRRNGLVALTIDEIEENNDNIDIVVSTQPPEGEGWVRDPDTLDTWFSSGMWTFSTLGWPEAYQNNKKSGDLAQYHPTQMLETGYEILTLWVSRMIMMSLFALQEIPFEKVYLHGMVLDKEGKKMSKSKGNGIDPVEMIDKYGADAMRLSLLIGNSPGKDIKMSEEKIEGFRNFVNKFWNISRFIMQKDLSSEELDADECTLADKWILNRMSTVAEKVKQDMREYRFSQAGELLRDFTWSEFADWYLEVGKVEKNEAKNKIFYQLLTDLLKMWHPFIPFVTEAVWQNMKTDEKDLMIQDWPEAEKYNKFRDKGGDFEIIKNIVSSIRQGRSQYSIAPGQKIKVIIYSKQYQELIGKNAEIIKNLQTNAEELKVESSGEKIKKAFYQNLGYAEVYIPLETVIDLEAEKSRLEKELERTKGLVKGLEKKLNNENFLKNAPEEVVEKEKNKHQQQKERLNETKKQIQNLE